MNLLTRFLATNDDLMTAWLRVVTGGIILAHGVQKLFGWFGGHGPAAVMESFQKWFGLPPAVTFLVILADSLGAFALILGLGTRFMAAAITLVMLGAIWFVHGRWGFYMNWYAQQRGEGFEFHLLVLALTVYLVVRGGGRWSLDRWLHTRLTTRRG